MKYFKRGLAMLLALDLAVGSFVMDVHAENAEIESRTIAAEEVENVVVFGGNDAETGTEVVVNDNYKNVSVETYSPEDVVTVIVQMTDPALMEYYGISSYALDAEEDMTAGEAVSEFLCSEDAVALEEEIQENQEVVLDEIAELANDAETVNGEMEVVGQYAIAMNGVAVRVPFGWLSAIRNLDGVKRAYVEKTYARPEEVSAPNTEAGVAGYSYDMTNLSETWALGYTGRRMLVAVLDTGIDIEFASFWDDEANANVTGIRRTHEAFTDDSFKNADAKNDLRFTNESLAAFLETTTLNAELNSKGDEVVWDNNALYKNMKVPFAYDYAGATDEYGEVIGGDLNARPTSSEHGTHVAGTVAGYYVDEEGVVQFSGVAPDAQILALKVFPDENGGAQESVMMKALEDALKLGADVINLSLGSDNGFADDDTPQAEVYKLVDEAGIIMMTSAGNSAFSSSMNQYGGYNKTESPDITMMSSPAIYDSNVAVAAINNTIDVQSVFSWTDAEGVEHTVGYNDPNGTSVKYKFLGGEPVRIYPVGGVGEWQDYYDAGFRTSSYDYNANGEQQTGIALVQRGAISFVDKIRNAQSFNWTGYDYSDYPNVKTVYGGVQAVIVYDNVDGELITMGTDGTSLTSCFISKADGEAIVEAVNSGCAVYMNVLEKDVIVSSPTGAQMSSFSSWGAGPGLELKPEITAPGGNIWSTIPDWSYRGGSGYYNDYTGSYEMMSGTSMAAPHMSGLTALVEEYVRENGYKATKKEEALLTEQLLISTAVPQIDEYGYFYSPRLQGSGLVNVAAAVKTPAYITVADQQIGKIELGDDPEWSGSYQLTFDVNNLTDKAVSYKPVVYVMYPDCDAISNGEKTALVTLDSDLQLAHYKLNQITVPANGKVTVDYTVELTDEQISELRTMYPNGTYIEGYVTLKAVDPENPTLGLPYLGFLGDWTAAPIFDTATWLDGDFKEDYSPWYDGDYTWYPTLFGSSIGGMGFVNLGQNPFDPTAETSQMAYHRANITLSPNGDGYLDVIDDIEIYQLRDAKLMVVEVHDAKTNELYFHDVATYIGRTTYNANYQAAIPYTIYWFTEKNWAGTDSEGNRLPSGTKCIYTVTAYGEGEYAETFYEDLGYYASDFMGVDPSKPETEPTFNGHAMDKTGDVINFPVTIDYVAPKLVNNAVSLVEEDGRVYMVGKVYDEDGSLASIEIDPLVTRSYKSGYGDPDYAEVGVDRVNPFLSDMIYDAGVKTWTFKADVTEYAHTNESYTGENYYYNYEWTGNVLVSCGDYGANDRSYAIKVADAVGKDGIVLSQTSALLHPGSEFDLSVINNSASDAKLIRKSSDPSVATIDEYGHIVAVAPGQTTITVSNGSSSAVCVVAVEDYATEIEDFKLSIDHFSGLKPNGSLIVKVTDLQPSDVVINDISWAVSEDDATAEWYEGLITCAKYDSDGLIGEIYLNTSGSTDGQIPGGAGELVVTINGLSRSMTIDWEDLYTSENQDDLTSDLSFEGEQAEYVKAGETATLIAKYMHSHKVIPVAIYTAEGYQQYSYDNPLTEAPGLVLDGPDFATEGSFWTGKIVNTEGYALPNSIIVTYRYDYGYEYELMPGDASRYGYYEYNAETGDIKVNAPTGETTIVVRADGIVSEGNPAGELSGITYTRPDGTWGPFNWEIIGGVDGTLTTAEDVQIDYYTKKNVAYFVANEPGVSYIRATSKDGQYSLNFAVVTEPVKAETITVEDRNLTMEIGDTKQLEATLSPIPSLAKDQKIVWKSFEPAVVSVDENGLITAVSGGYAYVKACSASDSSVMTSVLVYVKGETVSPEEPQDPDPEDPVDPVDPVDPIDPVEPIEPARPVVPLDPTKPIDSMKPADLNKNGSYEENGSLVLYEDGEKIVTEGAYKVYGNYYYVKKDGTLQTGVQYIGSKFLNGTGLEKNTYHIRLDGSIMMNTGAVRFEEGLDENGSVQYSEKMYYMINGIVQKKPGIYSPEGTDKSYYVNYDGSVVQDKFYTLGKDKDGKNIKKYFDENGVMYSAEGATAKTINGVLYLFDDGRLLENRGLVKVGNDYYYAQYNGQAVINKTYAVSKYYNIDNEEKVNITGKHHFGENGKMDN